MVLAYVLALSLLCTTQVAVASSATLVAQAVGDDSSQLPPPHHDAPPLSPARAARTSTTPASPHTPTPKTSAIQLSPAPVQSPLKAKLTPGRPGNPRDRGSLVVVRTDRAEILRQKLAVTTGLSVHTDDIDSSVFIAPAVTQRLKTDCKRYLTMSTQLFTDLAAKLTTLDEPFELTDLYPEEVAFWDQALVKIDARVITKMPSRRLLGVIVDRENDSPTSDSFNGKNKKNVFHHAFAYEFLYGILTSPHIRAYKTIYETDLSAAKDESMLVAYKVIELHYPTELEYVKSPNSPVGGRPTDDKVITHLGSFTSVIAFSQAPAALRAAYASATPRDMGAGRMVPFIENRFNWIFHAQHQKGVAEGLIPVQVEVIIANNDAGRECLELVEVKDVGSAPTTVVKSSIALFR